MSLLKIFHRIDKSLNALDWKSIIERRTETAYRTVTLDAHDAPFRAEVNEIFLKFLKLGGLTKVTFMIERESGSVTVPTNIFEASIAS